MAVSWCPISLYDITMSSYTSPQTINEFDSDEFSLYSLSSELDLHFSYRGGCKGPTTDKNVTHSPNPQVTSPDSLLVLTAKAIALNLPFEVVESYPFEIPDELQRLIAFHSFPVDEDDIWLYSCLSCGGSYEFDQGEALWADKAVKECVQIGFHLSATVLTSLHVAPPMSGGYGLSQQQAPSDSHNQETYMGTGDPYYVSFSTNNNNNSGVTDTAGGSEAAATGAPTAGTGAHKHNMTLKIEPGYPAHRVSMTFDRRRITSCSCTCTFDMEERCVNLPSPRDFPDDEEEQEEQEQANVSGYTVPYMPLGGPSRGRARSHRGYSSGTATGLRPRRDNPASGCSCEPTAAFGRQQSNRTGSAQAAAHPPPPPVAPQPGTWCSHVVATCLMRIRQPEKVMLRAPISESLSKLSKEDLQKFAQNLICHVGPRKILPAAQRILDQLLASTDNPLKSCLGAPDPTSGGAVGDAAAWCFDGAVLEEKLRVTLRRFWASKPSVLYNDIGSLNLSLPVDVENFYCILHSLRGNEPRGLWDLLSIIGDMIRRQDSNGVLLLEIVTRCILDIHELIPWWYAVHRDPNLSASGVPVLQKQTQYASFWLCEEVVQLWRLVCLNPDLRLPAAFRSGPTRFPSGSSAGSSPGGGGPGRWLLQQLVSRLRAFHLFALEQAGIAVPSPLRSLASSTSSGSRVPNLAAPGEDDGGDKASERFYGFKPALAACSITWPSELPPSSGLTIEEFRVLVPDFFGARPQPCSGQLRPANWSDFPGLHHLFDWLGTNKSLDGVTAMDDVIAAAATYGSGGVGTGLWDYQQRHFFSDLPIPASELELAYSRFQAMDAHGHKEQALLWARYLALRLLHLAPGYTGAAELAAFKVVSDAQASTVSPLTTSGAPGQVKAQATPLGGRSVASGGARRNKRQCPTVGDVRQRSRGIAGGLAGAETPASAHRSELAAVAVCEHNQLAIEWANKTSQLLDQIRCLIKCLCQAYHDSLPNPNLSSANRITSSGRSLLTYRGGPDPACCLQLRLENQAAVMHTQPRQPDSGRIEDEWTRFDIELAFRLGFYGLSLPRPPCQSPTLEVRLFDQEVSLLTRLCGLPLHLACPRTALYSIRQEASRIAHELSAYEADILVPYNAAAFVFHHLVGIHSQHQMVETSSGAAAVFDLSQATGMTFAGPSVDGSAPTELEAGLASRASQWYPVLATGAILSGSGRPLAVDAAVDEQEDPLGEAVAQDAELGFQAVLRVLSCQSRVPESAYHYFVESQRSQLDALAIYLLGHYRDNLDRLDRLLAPLLDRRYNPYFKAPPLWACFNLPPTDLIQFGESRQPSPPPPPSHVTSDGGVAAAVSHDLDGSAPVWRVASRTENFPPDAAPPPPVPSTSQPSTESPERTGFYVEEQQQQPPGVAASQARQTSASEDTDTVSDSKLWMDTFRCVTLSGARRRTRPSVGMAAVDTSAPETTSSDNSPAVCRRFHLSPPVALDASDGSPVVATTTGQSETTTIKDKSRLECEVAGEATTAVPDQPLAPAKRPSNRPVPNSSFLSSSSSPSSSDNSSSSTSSESLVTSFEGRDEEELAGETDGPAAGVLLPNALESASGAAAGDFPATESIKSPADTGQPPAVVVGQRHSTWPAGCLRPPAQPLSDSLAFHTFNFSKLVRRLAGGPTAAGWSVFVPEASAQSMAVNRNLLLVSFQIGLYGLGLYNALTPSWRSRTYSRNGNWISQLVFEIGVPAAGALYHCWRNHLTAAELANIAFQLSLKNDRPLVDIAVELCLASLTMCVTLKPHEIYRALTQCEEHHSASLERGLLCVETSDQEHRASTASTTGLLPEIYFHLARNWFSLYKAIGNHDHDDEEDWEHKLASASLAPGQEATCTVTALAPSLVYQNLVSGVSGSAAARPTGFFPGSGVSTSSYSAASPPPLMSFPVSMGSWQLQAHPNPYLFYPPPAADGPQSTSALVYFSSPQFGAPATAQHQSCAYQAAVGSSGQNQGTSMFVYSDDYHYQHPSTNTPGGLVPMNPGTGVGPPPTQSAPVGDLVSALGLTGVLFPPGTASTSAAAGRPCGPPPVYSIPPDPSMAVSPPPGVTFAYPTVSMGDHPYQHHLYHQAPVSSCPGLPPGSLVDSQGHAMILTGQQPGNRASSPVEVETTAVNCVGGGSGGEPLLQALEGKGAARRYLVRAYHCAIYAIRLLYVPSVSDSTSSSSGVSATPGLHTSTGSTAHTSGSAGSRGGGGARNRHHYHGNHGSTAGGTPGRSFGSPAVMARDTPGHRRAGGGPSWNSLDGGPQQTQYNNNRLTTVDGATPALSGTSAGTTTNTTVSSYPMSVKTNDANILWTLEVAIRLGPSTVQEYCNLLMHCIHCPLVMNQVTQNTIDYYKRRHRQQETRITAVDPSCGVTATTTSSAVHQFWMPPTGQAHGQMPTLAPSYPGKFFYPQQQVMPQQPTLLPDGLTYQLGNWIPFSATAAALWSRMPSGPPIYGPQQQQPLVLGHGDIPFPPPASIPPPTWNTNNNNSAPPQTLSYHHQQQLQHGMLPAFLGMPSSGVTSTHHPPPPPPPVAPSVVANRLTVGQVGYAVQQQHQHQQPQQQPMVPLASNATRRLASVLGMRVSDEGMGLIERLVNRTHDLFHRYIDYRLQYTGLAQSDWDELVELILQAYSVYWSMPATEAGLHWNSLLTRIRRHHKCTNALWQRIFAGIQTADLKRATT